MLFRSEQVLKNAKSYKEQASKILDFGGKNPVEIKYNSEWLAKMNLNDVVELASYFTVQQMLERDMFEKRMVEGRPIHIHEFLYPLMQGYDSVAMDVDGEVGGNDQTFNMLAGRDLMKAMRGKEKFVITNKLLEDTSGKKMGKTEGNMVCLSDSSDEMFGKIMSWTDGMIAGGFELLTGIPMDEVSECKDDIESGRKNPRDAKARLAREIVGVYHGADEAQEASDRFDRLFQKKQVPDELPEKKIIGERKIVDLLIEIGFAKSKSDARRLIEGGGVKIDGDTISDPEKIISPKKGGVLIQKGKRFFLRIIAE